jgi:hypothetical protein
MNPFLEEKSYDPHNRLEELEKAFRKDVSPSKEALLRHAAVLWKDKGYSTEVVNGRLEIVTENLEIVDKINLFFSEEMDSLRVVQYDHLPGCPENSTDKLILTGHEDIANHIEKMPEEKEDA